MSAKSSKAEDTREALGGRKEKGKIRRGLCLPFWPCGGHLNRLGAHGNVSTSTHYRHRKAARLRQCSENSTKMHKLERGSGDHSLDDTLHLENVIDQEVAPQSDCEESLQSEVSSVTVSRANVSGESEILTEVQVSGKRSFSSAVSAISLDLQSLSLCDFRELESNSTFFYLIPTFIFPGQCF